MRAGAAALAQWFTALTAAGFDERQALSIVASMVVGAANKQ